jgi:hypothetical protein
MAREPSAAAADMIYKLIYVSSAWTLLDAADLAGLLGRARKHNAAHGITGLLVYCGGNFFQALEGPETDVSALLTKIERDPSHFDVKVIWQAKERERDFTDWSMGFRQFELPDLAENGYRELTELLKDTRAATDGVVSRLLRLFLEGNCQRS